VSILIVKPNIIKHPEGIRKVENRLKLKVKLRDCIVPCTVDRWNKRTVWVKLYNGEIIKKKREAIVGFN